MPVLIRVMLFFHCLCLASLVAFAQQLEWLPTNGPYGGVIVSLAARSTGEVYAATRSNGIWHLAAGEQRWRPTAMPAPSPLVMKVNDRGILLGAIVRELIRSSDGGESWSAPQLDGQPEIADIAIDSSDNFWLASRNGIYYSDDDALSWQLVAGLPTNTFWMTIACNTRGVLFAVSAEGLYRSSDGGASWQLRASDPGDPRIRHLAVGPDDELLAFDFRGLGDTDRLWHSTDNGDTWIRRDFALADTKFLTFSSEGTLVAGSDLEIQTSTDRGLTWTLSLEGALLPPRGGLTEASAALFLATEYGVYRSSNEAADWEELNDGLMATEIETLVSAADGTILSAGKQGLFHSATKGAEWQTRDFLDIMSLERMPDDRLLAGRSGGKDVLLSSTDNGREWQPVGAVYWDEQCETEWCSISALAGRGGDVVVAYDLANGLHKSTDAGVTWSRTNSGGAIVSSMAFGPGPNLFLGSNDLLFSSDCGVNLNSDPSFSQISFVNDLAVSAGGRLVLATDAGLYYSAGFTQAWQAAPLGGASIIKVRLLDEANILAASAASVFHSRNGGRTWTEHEPDIPADLRINDVDIDSDGVLYIATAAGAYRSRQTITTDLQQADVDVSQTARIRLVNPGPVSSAAMFRITSPRAARLSLSLYDVRGRRLGAGVELRLPAGATDFSWAIGPEAPGYYFAVLSGADLPTVVSLGFVKS